MVNVKFHNCVSTVVLSAGKCSMNMIHLQVLSWNIRYHFCIKKTDRDPEVKHTLRQVLKSAVPMTGKVLSIFQLGQRLCKSTCSFSKSLSGPFRTVVVFRWCSIRAVVLQSWREPLKAIRRVAGLSQWVSYGLFQKYHLAGSPAHSFQSLLRLGFRFLRLLHVISRCQEGCSAPGCRCWGSMPLISEFGVPSSPWLSVEAPKCCHPDPSEHAPFINFVSII